MLTVENSIKLDNFKTTDYIFSDSENENKNKEFVYGGNT